MQDWSRRQFALPSLDILFSYFIPISQTRLPAGRIPRFSKVDDRSISLFVWENIRNQYAVSFSVFPQLVEGLFLNETDRGTRPL